MARKTSEVPALKAEIKRGSITVSKARKMTSVLNALNQDHWLKLARESSSRTIEKHVALISPKTAVREKANYINPACEIKEKT